MARRIRFILIMRKEKVLEEVEITESQYSSHCEERVSDRIVHQRKGSSCRIVKQPPLEIFQPKANDSGIHYQCPSVDLGNERV